MSPGSSRPTDESLSTAVIEAVADRRGVETTELPEKLFEVIDPDSLDTLFGDRHTTDGTVTFAYCGYTVTVTADGSVDLED